MALVLNTFEAMQQASGRAVDTAAIREAREEWARAGTAFDTIEENIRNANNEQQNFNNSIRGGSNSANGLLSIIKKVAIAAGGIAGINKALNISDELASTKARLNLLVDDGGSVEALEQKIMASAQRSRSVYFDTASAVAKLGLNAGNAFGGNMDQVIAFMEQVNKQFVIGGATAQEQSNAMIQLKDGSIGLSVDEKDRSWCSSNGTNDNRAITIEVASDTTHPYAVTAKAYAALLDLVTDICKRNGIKKLVWSTNKNDRVNHRNGCNMTVHRDFANKACPGEYLYSRHGEIAAEVNRRLQGASNGGGGVVTPPTTENPTGGTTGATVTPYLVRVKITNLNIRKGPGTNYGATGYIQPGIYTIVAESTGKGAAKWGKLKSGAGWISLDYATKT